MRTKNHFISHLFIFQFYFSRHPIKTDQTEKRQYHCKRRKHIGYYDKNRIKIKKFTYIHSTLRLQRRQRKTGADA